MHGWRSVRVADVAARASNALATGPFGSSIGSRFFRSSGVPVIRGGNLSINTAIRLSDENLVFLSPEKAAEFSRSTVRSGDLIFTSWGTINQVGMVDGSAAFEKYVISNKQMKLTPDPSVALAEFLYYLFSGPVMQRKILDGSIGTGVPGFNLTRLRAMEIRLPPIKEQRKIAEAISDAESLEKTLHAQIAKKQAIKQGMMEQLLTGQTRMPGFTVGWQQVKLGSLAQMGSGGTPSSSVSRYYGGGIPWVSISDMTTGGKYIRETQSTLSADGLAASAAKLYDRDVVLYAMYASIGECSLAVGRLSSSQAILGISVGQHLDREFLYYYLHFVKPQVKLLGQQGTQANLNAGMVRSFSIPLPEINEQRAISRVLGDADAEIDVLRSRLAKARDIKQGMMQQLLTGRIRLPLQEVAA